MQRGGFCPKSSMDEAFQVYPGNPVSSFIPIEIQICILEKLPVKTLVKCTAVCKSWNSIIRSLDFIKTRLLLSSSSTHNHEHGPHTLFLRTDLSDYSEINCFVLSQVSFSVHEVFWLNFRSHYPRSHLIKSGSCCNGVICLSGCGSMDYGKKLVLCNPSIRKVRVIPPSPRQIVTDCAKEYRYFGFGYDSVNDDYKVVRPCRMLDDAYNPEVYKFDFEREIEVYSLKSDSWKKVEVVGHRYFSGRSVFVNNATHWLCEDGIAPQSIVSFDFGKEVFHEMKLPIGCGYGYSFILAYKGSLAVLEGQEVAPDVEGVTVSLWVMKEYGVIESWSKIFTKVIPRSFEDAVGFSSNGKLIFGHGDCELAAWDPESGQVVDLVGYDEDKHIVMEEYVESLFLI